MDMTVSNNTTNQDAFNNIILQIMEMQSLNSNNHNLITNSLDIIFSILKEQEARIRKLESGHNE